MLLAGGAALAQAPNPVTPGYQICSSASGVTKCSFQPVGNGSASLTTYSGLPIAALAVATCGSQSLTAGFPYIATMDLTGTLCIAGGGGGGTTTVQGNQTNGATGVVSAVNVPTMSYNYVSPDNGATWAPASGLIPAPLVPATATATGSLILGCQYNSTDQVFTNGQQGSVGCDQRGGLYVQDGKAIPSASATSAATLFTIADTTGYGSVSVQVTSAGSSSTIAYEGSEDGTTWYAAQGYSSAASTGTGVQATNALALSYFPVVARQFRARVSIYGSGTITVQGTLRKDAIPRQAVLAAITGTSTVTGGLTDGTAVGTVNIGSVSEARTTNKTAVTTGQYVRPIATSIGAVISKPYQVPELDWSYAAASGGISNTTTAVTMVGAAASGIRNYITSCQFSSDALGAATELAIRDGAAGTVIWREKLGTAGLVGGQQISFTSPIKSTAATLLEVVTLTASITGAVYVNCQGYQAP